MADLVGQRQTGSSAHVAGGGPRSSGLVVSRCRLHLSPFTSAALGSAPHGVVGRGPVPSAPLRPDRRRRGEAEAPPPE